MTTSSIGSSVYSETSSLLKQLAEQKGTETATTKTSEQSANSRVMSSMGGEIQRYLEDIPKGSDGKLSFKEVEEYRKQLEVTWDVSVMADLEALGVDISKEFPLTYDPVTGKVTTAEGHPDKETIDKYFEDNPEKVDEFNKIIQLGKLTKVSENQLTNTELKQSLQQQAISWWYEDNSDPTNWFKGGGLMLGYGQSYTGLNLTV